MNNDLLLRALSKYGIREVLGDGSNPEIIAMMKECGFPDYVNDSVSWCGGYLNWVCFKEGYTRTKTLTARDWLKIGKKIITPEQGDVVVLWRISPDSWQGHVGLWLAEGAGLVSIIAGNQNDRVDVTDFPQTRILGYRRMEKI